MTLDEAIFRTCRELPEGWQIAVSLERGAGWAELFNPNGGNVTKEVNLSDMNLSEAVMACIHYANGTRE